MQLVLAAQWALLTTRTTASLRVYLLSAHGTRG